MRMLRYFITQRARGWFLSPSKGQPGSIDQPRAPGPSTGSGTGHPTPTHHPTYSRDTTIEYATRSISGR